MTPVKPPNPGGPPPPRPPPVPGEDPPPPGPPPPRPPPVPGRGPWARRFFYREIREWVTLAALVVAAVFFAMSQRIEMESHLRLVEIAEAQAARYAADMESYDARERADAKKSAIVMGSVQDWGEISARVHEALPKLDEVEAVCNEALTAINNRRK